MLRKVASWWLIDPTTGFVCRALQYYTVHSRFIVRNITEQALCGRTFRYSIDCVCKLSMLTAGF